MSGSSAKRRTASTKTDTRKGKGSTKKKCDEPKKKKKALDSHGSDSLVASPVHSDSIVHSWRSDSVTSAWVPYKQDNKRHRQNDDDDDKAENVVDRYDLKGTSSINELVLRHSPLPASTDDAPVSVFRPQRGTTGGVKSFHIHRYSYNLVRALVHPLHNFLQYHHGLHNADEVQVMLMPRNGPIADADRALRARSQSRKRMREEATVATPSRHCYVATNNETLSRETLAAATSGWGTASVFQIDGFTLVSGEKGLHAEIKLLEYLETQVLPGVPNKKRHSLAPAEKVLVVGERLPCAACRLYAASYEPWAQILPSHGHMYMSTLDSTMSRGVGKWNMLNAGKRQRGGGDYLSPAHAAATLLEKQSGRALR